MKNKIIAILVIVAVVVGAGSFYGGIIYQKNQSPIKNLSRNENGVNFQKNGQRMGQNNSGGAFENGEIISKDDKSITIKTRDGGSKIILFSNSTTVGKTVDGSTADLGVGNQVMVNGQTDASGIITAQNIQIRPDTPVGQNNR